MSVRTEIKPGVTLDGKYRVEELLGEGGMGKVLLATNVHLATKVAIKILRPELSASPTSRKRFLREAQLAARLQDDHVARVYDAVDGELQPYLVMELLRGQDLATVLERRGALPPTEAVFYVLQMLVALAEAHAAGIVHRDLKPANLFLTERSDGTPLVKVMDFGLSKDTDRSEDTAASLTKSFTLLGTPLYSSPEMLSNPKRVDARADIWAVGAILHELLAGRPTFGAPGLLEVIRLIREVEPPPLSRADVPAELEAVIRRCLQRKVDARYPSVFELARDLEPFGPPRAHELIVAISRLSKRPDVERSDTLPDPVHRAERPLPRPVDALADRALSASPHVSPVHASSQRPRRFVGAALAGAALAVTVIGIGAFGLHRRARDHAASEAAATAPVTAAEPIAPAPPAVKSEPIAPSPPAVKPEPIAPSPPAPVIVEPAPVATAPASASASAAPIGASRGGPPAAPVTRPRPKPETSGSVPPAGTSGFGGRH